VIKTAAKKYGYNFNYQGRPNWDTFSDLYQFASPLQTDFSDLHSKDYIDIQSLIWVLGSEEYPD
jgi:hypothetical protein